MPKSEIKTRIDSGFWLTEGELIRIKEAQNEQIKKISGGQDAKLTFYTKYSNGIVSQPDSLGDILQEENFGTRTLTRVTIIAANPNDETEKVMVTFNDASSRTSSNEPAIWYAIESDDRDWTFVTSSIIEERISKIKSHVITNFLLGRSFGNVPMIITAVAVAIFGFTIGSATSNRIDTIDRIKARSQTTIDYIYQMDLQRAQDLKGFANFPYIMMILATILLFVSFLHRPISRWFPQYAFYWGDATKGYDRKLSIIRFIVLSVVVAIVIGMATNYLYDRVK